MSDDATPPSEAPVRYAVSGDVGRLTLDRPRALNALDLDMIERIAAVLDAWEDDPAVRIVLLEGAGERGLCAGGDVRALHAHIAAGRLDEVARYFRAEYALNARIAEYPKPIVALADGITMGGGIGLAGHAAVRVVTERSRLAMPETRIGFSPDVGGTWLLARAPGRIGEYLGVTAGTMDAADALYAGFADHFLPGDRLPEFVDALTSGDGRPEDRLDAFCRAGDADPGPSRLAAARTWIDDAFAADTLAEVRSRLDAHGAPAASAAAALDELSPTGMAVTLAAVRSARTRPDLRAVLAQEYGIVLWFARTQPDLAEGIRAQLIDKDRTPAWRPAGIDELDPDIARRALADEPDEPLFARA